MIFKDKSQMKTQILSFSIHFQCIHLWQLWNLVSSLFSFWYSVLSNTRAYLSKHPFKQLQWQIRSIYLGLDRFILVKV